ncbi:MAG: glycosyltransferase family 39 protein [Candidatus Levybacteria bacterium]|nr:glycosyltransferase family 39 protein [Candidatus Levybacteria bacterium]
MIKYSFQISRFARKARRANFKFQIDIILVLIIVLGAFFRFYNLNWDSNFHLHPDERFLTMVGNAMRIPQSIAEYFDPSTSPLNPPNIGFGFFVYGTLPLFMNKLFAVLLHTDNYNSFTIQGRFLSGLFDLLVVVLVYKTALLFEKHYKLNDAIKYWAAFFYAIAVLPIQLSHFFAVDTFLNFFMFASFYFALKFSFEQKRRHVVLSAIFLGAAFASKISAIFIVPLVLFFILKNAFLKKKLYQLVILLGVFSTVTYITVRIADPYMFASNNFFDARINETFLQNLKTLQSFEGKDIWYPPGIQWIEKLPIIFSLINLIVFGIGIPFFFFTLAGLYWIVKRSKNLILVIALLWVTFFFLYQSVQFAQTMRYFIPIYPFLAIFSGLGFHFCITFLKKKPGYWYVFVVLVLIGSIFLWPIAFFSIYTKSHSRVLASEWIYDNIPSNSLILSEHWDDALPLPLPNRTDKFFRSKQLPVFDPDTPEKWDKINILLAQADYYILSSNRAWGSIPTVPEKYPQMSKFYDDLLHDKTAYRKIQEFTSYPTFSLFAFRFSLNDDWSDESFTVYDHPKVMVFKNKR